LCILGKTVKQYHEEKGERLQLINLGHFDKTKHIQWLKDNPSKLPKKVEFRKHVSHFYGDGDFCELSGIVDRKRLI
jgi:endoplasmic reticulum lectin 1